MNNFSFLYAIGAAVIWGLVYVIDQKILVVMSPVTLLTINYVIAAVVFIFVFFLTGNSFSTIVSIGKVNLAWLVFSVFLAVIASFLIITSIKVLGASTTSIFEITYPFFVAIFAFLLLKAPINWWTIFGAVLIFTGSLVILKFGKI